MGVLLLLGLLLRAIPSGSGDEPMSVRSTEPDGRRALYLLLEELGFQPSAWTRSPGLLPRGETLLVLRPCRRPPPGYGAADEEELSAPIGSTSTRRQRDPLHYLRFAEEGGTLLCFAYEEEIEFLTEVLGIDDFYDAEATTEDLGYEEVPTLVLPSGERLEEAWVWEDEEDDVPFFNDERFAIPDVGSPFRVLIADEAGRPLALRYSAGRGEIVVLAPVDWFLDNAELGQGQNALLFVRLVEELAPHGRVLFDEYALGGWVPDSPIALAFAPRAFPFSVHLLLWASLAIWLVAWTRGFPREPEPWTRISALARAQGLAGLLSTAGRWDVLGRMLSDGVSRRLGRSVDEVVEESGEVRDAEGLRRLGERLAQLEADVLGHTPDEER